MTSNLLPILLLLLFFDVASDVKCFKFEIGVSMAWKVRNADVHGRPSDDTYSSGLSGPRRRVSQDHVADCRLMSATAFVPHPHEGSSMESEPHTGHKQYHIGIDEFGFICRFLKLGMGS